MPSLKAWWCSAGVTTTTTTKPEGRWESRELMGSSMIGRFKMQHAYMWLPCMSLTSTLCRPQTQSFLFMFMWRHSVVQTTPVQGLTLHFTTIAVLINILIIVFPATTAARYPAPCATNSTEHAVLLCLRSGWSHTLLMKQGFQFHKYDYVCFLSCHWLITRPVL